MNSVAQKDRVYLIGNRIYFDKTRKVFILDSVHPKYVIYQDEFAQMVYIAMHNGALTVALQGIDESSESMGPMILKLPKHKEYEEWLKPDDAPENSQK